MWGDYGVTRGLHAYPEWCTDLCGEVGIKSEAFQVNTQHFGELDHTHLLLAVLETVCVCVCVWVTCRV